jgi:hypothetical protein
VARRGDLALALAGAAAGFACATGADVMAASSEMAPSVGFHAAADPDDEDEDSLRRRFSVVAAAVAVALSSSGAVGGGRRARLTKANSFIC